MSPRSARLARLSRSVTFSACHRLHSKSLSDEENLKLFGKCNNPNGHGHNYKGGKLISILAQGVTSCPSASPQPILAAGFGVSSAVSALFPLSTTENVAVFIWDSLQKLLPQGILYKVEVHETEQNVVVYKGEETIVK
ncbi:PTPS synthase, partial [Calcarius ornatus]|nr:PTPS synthase [Calcarius ornatus]